VFWAPRVLGILLIVFISLFALDVFDMGLSPSEVIVALFMHLIPSMLLAILLAVAWKYELIGGIVYLLFALWYSVTIVMEGAPPTYIVIIAGPVYLIGGLFIENWRRKRK